MSDVRAVDLPMGSIVADRRSCWRKDLGENLPWSQMGSARMSSDAAVDRALTNGAEVVRDGYGSAL